MAPGDWQRESGVAHREQLVRTAGILALLVGSRTETFTHKTNVYFSMHQVIPIVIPGRQVGAREVMPIFRVPSSQESHTVLSPFC